MRNCRKLPSLTTTAAKHEHRALQGDGLAVVNSTPRVIENFKKDMQHLQQ